MTALFRRKWAAVAFLFALSFALAARAEEADPRMKEMKKLFQNAVKAIENEQYDDAAKQFEEILQRNPTNADALELREMAQVRFYIQALNRGNPQRGVEVPEGARKLRENVMKLLEMASEAEKQRLTDKDRIADLVKRLGTSTYEERARIYIELTSAGRNAVPMLVQRLLDLTAPDYPEYRVRASVGLIQIGEEAVLPLTAALRTDSLPLRQDICFILGQIGDPRSAPYLLRAAKSDPAESVRRVAEESLAKIRRYAVVPDEPPQVALFRTARLYYYNDPSVQRSSRFGHAIWHWSEQKQLTMEEVPDLLYHVAMARTVATEALASDINYEPVLALLISAYHKEMLLIQRRLQMAKSNPDRKLSEMEEQTLRGRLEKSRNILLTLKSSGERNFYWALSLQLHDLTTPLPGAGGDPELARAVINDLAKVARPELVSQPVPAALIEPLRPSVIIVTPQAAVKESSAKAEAAVAPPEPAPSARARVDAASIFPQKIEAERKAMEATAPAVAEPSPQERETLHYLIASAHRIAAEKKEEMARRQEDALETEGAPGLDSNPLVQSLQNRDKGVRYSAACALVGVQPIRDFAASKTVVEILGQALTEKGVSTVLIIGKDDQAVNQLRDIVRNIGHVPYSANTTDLAVSIARSLPPKDLVIADSEMPDAITTFQKDPVIAAIPVLVFVKDADTAIARQTYGDKALGVVSLKQPAEQLVGEITKGILGTRSKSEGQVLSEQYARMGAEALGSIPNGGSPFSPHLAIIKDPLIGALDSSDPQVRIAATVALGKAQVMSVVPRLVDIYRAPASTQPEQRACIESLGFMLASGQPAPPEVVGLLEEIQKSGSVELRTYAVSRLRFAIPAPNVARLIYQQEAASPAALPPAPGEPAAPKTGEELPGLPKPPAAGGGEAGPAEAPPAEPPAETPPAVEKKSEPIEPPPAINEKAPETP